jgi:hypothetical protein
MARLMPLVVLALVACGCSDDVAPGEPPDTAPDVINAADSGRTFELAMGAETSLRLSSEYSWEEPQLSGDAVELSPVDYLQDPGFTEWLMRGVRPGDATISSEGTPACAGQHGCPDEPITFRVTITVAE